MTHGRDWSVEIDALRVLMSTYYLDPAVAVEVNRVLGDGLAAGDYTACHDDRAFADAVTADTLAASGDLHLRLRYSRSPLPDRDDLVVPQSGTDPKEAAASGHGFARVERLPGNVGLIDIRRFWPLSMSRHAAVAAMHLVADADVLVVDLRRGIGGEPDMVTFLCSYLFEERVHLEDLYFPADDRTIEWWTDPSVPPPRFGGTKPVYLLISGTTFSAAEGFSYDLQQLDRAVLIGETTAGAANFDYRYRVSDHLMFSVPSGYPVNPVSGVHWEGTGVRPDLAIDPGRAFTTAYALALDDVIGLGDEGHRGQLVTDARRAREALSESDGQGPGGSVVS